MMLFVYLTRFTSTIIAVNLNLCKDRFLEPTDFLAPAISLLLRISIILLISLHIKSYINLVFRASLPPKANCFSFSNSISVCLFDLFLVPVKLFVLHIVMYYCCFQNGAVITQKKN